MVGHAMTNPKMLMFQDVYVDLCGLIDDLRGLMWIYVDLWIDLCGFMWIFVDSWMIYVGLYGFMWIYG